MEQPLDALSLREPIAGMVRQNQFRAALELCETGRHAFPQDPWLPTIHAYVLLQIGESEKAGQAATEALALGSDDPLAVLVLGVAHRNRGRHAEAAETLLAAHRLFPDRLDAATMVIEETVAAHGLEAARAVYEEVYGRLPDHGVAVCWATLLFGADPRAEMPPAVVSAPLMSVPAWLAKTGATAEFLGDQEIIRLEEPPIFGEPDAERFMGSVPGYVSYAATLRDATVFAKSSLVLMPGGVVLNDMLADERYGRYLLLTHDKTVIHREDDRLLVDVGKHRIEELDAGIMLSGWASEHFGHWVPEYIFRLAYLERHPRFAELPIIVDSDMPIQHLEYLRLLVSNPIVQIPAGGGLRCRELVVGSPSTFFPVHLSDDHQVPPENHGGLPTESMRFVQERVMQRSPPSARQGRKLYLSRKSRGWRRLLNEDEISATLAVRGFEILFPETMSFEEQVKMYQGAEVVVAPNGSSLLNAIFAPKALKLIVLSQRGLFNWATFYGPMHELGYDMTFVCSDEQTDYKHGDYAIPLARLIAALDTPPA
ncbi:MAG: glycosyltransferase family 61 protein [Alphaproteobacteria bacterium]|nr:glycosyltransferase family 61 protein [Alphaproteobacteria bacterium]MBU1514510.1 glycosyltransferase family 61 protein [Alphaproteobacteria bacterium]MBU2096858.1 glycosyltransferase family 61 protein [Alphaproteobacteria bacterium]MBU2153485.1 glycosyltransferase family 61 protein [Alphaproteobacteria bacterium]MBU2306010.1 glycosyltransferase family 61 protein [Alphaproteobacteria bacterium]